MRGGRSRTAGRRSPLLVGSRLYDAGGPAVFIRRGPFQCANQNKVLAQPITSPRRPLKNGCRTFPSADFARYSISASSSGSTRCGCAYTSTFIERRLCVVRAGTAVTNEIQAKLPNLNGCS